MDKSVLRGAGVELLSRVKWQLFATLTFDPAKLRRRHGQHRYEKEWRALRLLFNSVNLESFGRQKVRRHGAGLLWFAAIEPHRISGHHFHVLIAGIPNDRLDEITFAITKWWHQTMGERMCSGSLVRGHASRIAGSRLIPKMSGTSAKIFADASRFRGGLPLRFGD